MTLFAFVASAWLVQWLPALPHPGIAALLAFGVPALAALPTIPRRPRHSMGGLSSGAGAGGGIFASWLKAGVLAPLVVGAATGFGWAAWRASLRVADRLDPAVEGQVVTVSGMVASLPVALSPGWRFVFTPEPAPPGEPPRRLPQRWQLSWTPGPPRLSAGDRLTLTVRLRRPRGLANPHGFDQELWLLQRGIGALGEVRHGAPLAPAPAWRRWSPARMRGWLRDRLVQAMPAQAPFGGVLIALAIGDQSGIAPAQWTVFNRTGVGHLISISGLHITMLAGAAGALAGWGWRRSLGLARWLRRPLPLRCPAQRVAALAAGLAALGYGLVSGMEIPAQRTVMMVATAALALWCHRAPPASLALAWAAAVAVLLDPWAATAPGFWLSYGAVCAIYLAMDGGPHGGTDHVAASQRAKAAASDTTDGAAPQESLPLPARWRARIAAGWRDAVRVQWAVTAGLAGLTLVLFQQLSLVSPLANAVAIPVVSVLVTPLALAAAALCAIAAALPAAGAGALQAASAGLLGGGDLALRALHALLAPLSAPDWAVWQPARAGPLAILLAAPGTLALLAPSRFGWRLRLHGLLLLGPLLAAGRTALPAQRFRATVFDVGQGTAVLIETRRHSLLYDAGPAYGTPAKARPGSSAATADGAAPNVSPSASGFVQGLLQGFGPLARQPSATPRPGAAERVIVPFLRATAVRRLDALVISHEDADHAGGAAPVLAALPVHALYSGAPADHPLLAAPVGHEPPIRAPCVAGQAWEWDGVRFAFLHPAFGDAGRKDLRSNARSCVLRVVAPSGALLLAGDIDAASERAIIARWPPEALRSQLLLVPHHGSLTSSSPAWLDAVQPAEALFQLGYRNRYHHPHPRVWARYASRGIGSWRTDLDGALQVEAVPQRLVVTGFRRQQRRYWRDARPTPDQHDKHVAPSLARTAAPPQGPADMANADAGSGATVAARAGRSGNRAGAAASDHTGNRTTEHR